MDAECIANWPDGYKGHLAAFHHNNVNIVDCCHSCGLFLLRHLYILQKKNPHTQNRPTKAVAPFEAAQGFLKIVDSSFIWSLKSVRQKYNEKTPIRQKEENIFYSL